jgi:multiple sugar transport system substrate-binding protein
VGVIDRRRSRRSILAGALAPVGAGLVAACGGGQEQRAPLVSERRPDVDATPTSGTGRALSGGISVVYADELGKKPRYVEEAAATVQQAHPGVSVDIRRFQVPGAEFVDAVRALLRDPQPPDVVHVGGDTIGELADAGLIAPLDGYVRAWPEWQYYAPTVREGVTYQNQVWAIPYGLDTRFLYFRRDVFDRVGLGADWQPKTVADILTAATRVRAERRDVIPYALYAGAAGGTGTANHGFLPLVYAYGGALKDARGNWIGDSAAIRKALAFYAAAYQREGVVPADLASTPRSWVGMRERLGDGRLAMLFEGGWVYGGWAEKDRAGTEKNVGYLLFPTESAGPSFTIGGAGTCWFIAAGSANKDLAWEYIATFNNRDTVGRLNAEDPHPVARVDSVRVPEYRGDKFLVESTESMRRAYFTPPDAEYPHVTAAIQTATFRVATGELTPDETARRFLAELRETVGANRVVSQV